MNSAFDAFPLDLPASDALGRNQLDPRVKSRLLEMQPDFFNFSPDANRRWAMQQPDAAALLAGQPQQPDADAIRRFIGMGQAAAPAGGVPSDLPTGGGPPIAPPKPGIDIDKFLFQGAQAGHVNGQPAWVQGTPTEDQRYDRLVRPQSGYGPGGDPYGGNANGTAKPLPKFAAFGVDPSGQAVGQAGNAGAQGAPGPAGPRQPEGNAWVAANRGTMGGAVVDTDPKNKLLATPEQGAAFLKAAHDDEARRTAQWHANEQAKRLEQGGMSPEKAFVMAGVQPGGAQGGQAPAGGAGLTPEQRQFLAFPQLAAQQHVANQDKAAIMQGQAALNAAGQPGEMHPKDVIVANAQRRGAVLNRAGQIKQAHPELADPETIRMAEAEYGPEIPMPGQAAPLIPGQQNVGLPPQGAGGAALNVAPGQQIPPAVGPNGAPAPAAPQQDIGNLVRGKAPKDAINSLSSLPPGQLTPQAIAAAVAASQGGITPQSLLEEWKQYQPYEDNPAGWLGSWFGDRGMFGHAGNITSQFASGWTPAEQARMGVIRALAKHLGVNLPAQQYTRTDIPSAGRTVKKPGQSPLPAAPAR